MTGRAPGGSAVVVARNSAWLSLDAAVSLVATVVISVAVARVLGPENLGYYNYVMFIVGMSAAIATRGITLGAQKYAADAVGSGDSAAAVALLRRALIWQAWIATVLVAIGVTVVALGVPAGHRAYALLAVLGLGPLVLMGLFTAGLTAAERLRDNTLSSLAGVATNVALTFVALFSGWDLVGLTFALLASRVVDCAFRYLAFQRLQLDWDSRATDEVVVSEEVDRGLRRFARDATFLMVLDIVVWDRSEILILKHFSDVTQLAFFSLSFNMVQQLLRVPRIFVWAVSARQFAQHAQAPARVTELTAASMRYLALLSIPACLGMAALADPLIRVLYGPRYLPAIPVLMIVAALSLLRGFLMPAQELLRAADRQAFLLRWGAVLAAVNIALDFWWIPPAGAVGAAWANGTAQAIGAAGVLAYASRQLELTVPWGTIAAAIVASVPMILVVSGLVSILSSGLAIAIAIPVGAAVYVAALRYFAVLGPADRSRFLSLATALPARFAGGYARLVNLLVPARAA